MICPFCCVMASRLEDPNPRHFVTSIQLLSLCMCGLLLLVDAEAIGLHRSQLWFAAEMSVRGGGWLSGALVSGVRDE